MVRNIGFGPDATHTFSRRARTPSIAREIPAEIVHPTEIEVDAEADDFEYRTEHRLGLWHELKQVIKPLVPWVRRTGSR
jgi:hypothetical protein